MEIGKYTQQKGSFLKAENVTKNPNALWEITAEGEMVVSEKFGTERLHIPVKVGEEEYIFDTSKTNARTIQELTKETNTAKWVGKFLVLETYKTKTSDGKMTEAINVKEVK